MTSNNSSFLAEVTRDFSIIVVGSFAFVVALAWNDALYTLFSQLAGDDDASRFLYAIFMTLMLLLILYFARRIVAEDNARLFEVNLGSVAVGTSLVSA